MKINDSKITYSIRLFEKTAIEKYGSVRQFIIQNGHLETNFKVKLRNNLEKINKWLDPIGLKIEIKKQDHDT